VTYFNWGKRFETRGREFWATSARRGAEVRIPAKRGPRSSREGEKWKKKRLEKKTKGGRERKNLPSLELKVLDSSRNYIRVRTIAKRSSGESME